MEPIRRSGYWSGLLIQRLDPLLEETFLAEGTRLYSEGDPSTAVYVLRSGQLRVSMRKKGNEMTLQPESILGISAAVLGSSLGETAEALSDCRIGVMSREGFMELLERDFDICKVVLGILSSDVNESYGAQRSLAEPVLRPRKPRP